MVNCSYISQPAKPLSGEIPIPGDKSISHRAIIFAAIAKGTTTIFGLLESDDCLSTLKAIQSLGVMVERPDSQRLIIHGVGKYGLKAPEKPIDCGNSGTSMRLLAGLLAAQPFNSQLTGDASLLKRPMERISTPLTQMGAKIYTHKGYPPLTIQGGQTLHGITYTQPIASAQVKSCLLLAGLYAKGETTIIEPTLSRDHTEKMLNAFSYPISINDNDSTLTINAGSECRATEIYIPGDISSAAFFMVAAAIIPGSSIIIQQVGINPTRTGIITLLQMMGANIQILNPRFLGQEKVADIAIQYIPLTGITIPKSLIAIAIDEFPILCIAAASANGLTILHDAKELRVKESDRIHAMEEGLQQLGIETQSFEDGLTIKGGVIQGGQVNSFKDHRIAMAFAVAGAVAKKSITILDVGNVSTSFPNFVNTALKTGMAIQEISHE